MPLNVRLFEIELRGAACVRFVYRGQFSGVLMPLLWGRLNLRPQKGFEAMNTGLKQRAEAVHQRGKEGER